MVRKSLSQRNLRVVTLARRASVVAAAAPVVAGKARVTLVAMLVAMILATPVVAIPLVTNAA